MAAVGVAADTDVDVAILLAAYEGERFLPEQLRSFEDQSHSRWTLYWRDDGSKDATSRILQNFAARTGRCVSGPSGARAGAMRSFLALLGAARSAGATGRGTTLFAFADQDDVWLPDKLARGVRALSKFGPFAPAIYCSGQIVVDEQLRRIGRSRKLQRPPGFPASLTQNIATGCTLMLNAAAADIVLASVPPARTLHDWWCYLVVTAAGGTVVADAEATVLYRQHAGNLIGAPVGIFARGLAAFRRGPRPFMQSLREHVAALEAQPQLLTPAAREDLAVIAHGLRGRASARRQALRLPGFRRQSWQEDLVFRLWFTFG